MQQPERRFGGAKVGCIALWFGDVQRDALDPAAHQRAPPGKDERRRDAELAGGRQVVTLAPEQRNRQGTAPPRHVAEVPQHGVDLTAVGFEAAALDGGKHVALEQGAAAPAAVKLVGFLRLGHWAASSTKRAQSLGGVRQGGAGPSFEVGQCAGAQRRLSRAAQRTGRRRREQAEIDVHRLERARADIDGLDVAAGDVVEQRAMRRGRRRQQRYLAEPFRGGKTAGQKSDRRRFHIALAAGDLAGKAQPRRRFEPQGGIEQLRRIEKRVAMQAAQPRELGIGEARDGAENAHLLAVLQLGLKPTMLNKVPSLLSCRSCTTAYGFSPGRCGLRRPNGFIGPWRNVSRPRSAITSMGRQPSKYGVSLSKSWSATFSPASTASMKASYSRRVSGQLT